MKVLSIVAVVLLVSGVTSAVAQSVSTQPALVMPFPSGTRSQCVQGPGGAFSHRGNSANDVDLDTPNDRDWRVLAAATGVAYAHPDTGPNGFGNHVNVDHGNGYFTVYAHLKTILIGDRMPVVAGSVIGVEDNTGKSQGDHLHFGLHQGDPSNDATASRSVPIERLLARNVSLPGSGFVELRGVDLVCALPGGHIYESNTPVVATPQRSVPNPDTFTMLQGSSLPVPGPGIPGVPGILDNDDIYGELLSVEFIGAPAGLVVTDPQRGFFVYTPAPTFSGPITFGYRIVTSTTSSAPAVVTIQVTPRPVTRYTIESVGSFIASDVSDSGWVVGWRYDSQNQTIGVVRDATGQVFDISLPGASCSAERINASNSVLAYCSSVAGGVVSSQNVVWNRATGAVPLPVDFNAVDILDSGNVIGSVNSTGEPSAWMWNQTTGLSQIWTASQSSYFGTVCTQMSQIARYAFPSVVSPSGRYVAAKVVCSNQALTAITIVKAVFDGSVWTVPLDPTGLPLGASDEITSVNDHGQIVGFKAPTSRLAKDSRGIVWTGAVSAYVPLLTGFTGSAVQQINNSGDTVVAYYTSASTAILYVIVDSTGRLQQLTSLVPVESGVVLRDTFARLNNTGYILLLDTNAGAAVGSLVYLLRPVPQQ